jgi:hypothetical protein
MIKPGTSGAGLINFKKPYRKSVYINVDDYSTDVE